MENYFDLCLGDVVVGGDDERRGKGEYDGGTNRRGQGRGVCRDNLISVSFHPRYTFYSPLFFCYPHPLSLHPPPPSSSSPFHCLVHLFHRLLFSISREVFFFDMDFLHLLPLFQKKPYPSPPLCNGFPLHDHQISLALFWHFCFRGWGILWFVCF